MVTVEADPVRVESRLAARQVDCPCCPGVLRPWGWARPRGVHGIDGVRRPRRARCGQCLVTHVLLPVTVLLRRAYAAEVIGAALLQLLLLVEAMVNVSRFAGSQAVSGSNAGREQPQAAAPTSSCRRHGDTDHRSERVAVRALTASNVTGRSREMRVAEGR